MYSRMSWEATSGLVPICAQVTGLVSQFDDLGIVALLAGCCDLLLFSRGFRQRFIAGYLLNQIRYSLTELSRNELQWDLLILDGIVQKSGHAQVVTITVHR
jgi:hypothetical protein